MDYHKKYIKYKNKYMLLKEQLGAGCDDLNCDDIKENTETYNKYCTGKKQTESKKIKDKLSKRLKELVNSKPVQEAQQNINSKISSLKKNISLKK